MCRGSSRLRASLRSALRRARSASAKDCHGMVTYNCKIFTKVSWSHCEKSLCRVKKNMPFTYILKSQIVQNWHYVGSCHILEDRFKQHKKGSVRSTKSKRPLKIIFSKEFGSITEAKKYENYFY